MEKLFDRIHALHPQDISKPLKIEFIKESKIESNAFHPPKNDLYVVQPQSSLVILSKWFRGVSKLKTWDSAYLYYMGGFECLNVFCT